MRKPFVLLLLLTASACIAGCAERRPPPGRGFGRPPGAGGMARGRVFISPMGEPFRRAEGPGPGEGRGDLIDRWFAEADTDHDGILTVPEFERDAARFFATLDTDHDGEIAPPEIIRYETEIAPEIQMAHRLGIGGGGGFRGGGGGGGRGGWGGRRGGGGGGHGGGGYGGGGGGGRRFGGGGPSLGLLDIPEPVASADFDLNRGVSADEFRRAAGQRFLLLDRDHDGRIARAELNPPEPDEGARRR